MKFIENEEIDHSSKIEQVQNKKQEYKLIGTYHRTRGLNLYGYKPDGTIFQVNESNKDTITLDVIDGKLGIKEIATKTADVDERNIYFEALNLRSAEKRVKKWKQGLVSDLCNLTKPKTLS